MKKQTILGVLFVLIVLALFSGENVFASSVTISLGSIQAATGGTAEVPLQVTGASNIGAIQMVLVYDAAVLTPETVTQGSLAGNNALMDSNSQTPGRIGIGLVTLDGIQGDGTLATVSFKVIGAAGQSSQLSLEKVEAWEKSSYAPVLVNTEPGQLTIGAAKASGKLVLLAICGGGILLLVAALGLGLVIMRSRKRPASAPATNYPPPPPPMQPVYQYAPARLTIVQGRANYPYLDLSAGGVIIGRDSTCGLVLQDYQVSGQHARLEWTGSVWVIRDLNSSNGTYLNGAPLARGTVQALRPGDRIQIGQTVMVFQA